jgi:hypothetical protein
MRKAQKTTVEYCLELHGYDGDAKHDESNPPIGNESVPTIKPMEQEQLMNTAAWVHEVSNGISERANSERCFANELCGQSGQDREGTSRCAVMHPCR